MMKNCIKNVRTAKNISRKDLSEMTRIPYKRLGDYETNYYKTENITVGSLYRIAKALDVPIESLLVIDPEDLE